MVAISESFARKIKRKPRKTYLLREVYENESFFRCLGHEQKKLVEELYQEFSLKDYWGKRTSEVCELEGYGMKIRVLYSKNILQRVYVRYYGGPEENSDKLIRLRKKLCAVGLERKMHKGYDIEPA